MKDEMLSRAWIVEDHRAAAVLANDRLRSILLLFALQPRTLAEAVPEAGMDVKRLHHHVQTIKAAGLLEVVGERPRAGRPCKLYRSVADSFFVGDEWLPRPFTQSLAKELRQSLEAHFRSGRGMLFGIGPDGEPRARRVEQQNAPSHILDLWFVARIDPDHLADLKERVRALIREFEDRSGAMCPTYLLHAAAAPRRPR